MHDADGSEETVEAGQVYHWPAGLPPTPTKALSSSRSDPSAPCASSESTPSRCSAECTTLMLAARLWPAARSWDTTLSCSGEPLK